MYVQAHYLEFPLSRATHQEEYAYLLTLESQSWFLRYI
jgi:hypothetical protein